MYEVHVLAIYHVANAEIECFQRRGEGETMLRTSCIHCKYHFKKKMCNSCGIFIHNCTSVLVKYQDLFLTCFVYFCMNLYYFLSFLSALLSFRPDSICKVIIFLMQLVFADHEQKKAFSCHIKSAKVSKPLQQFKRLTYFVL